jgi:Flp pilus assembly protein CpaB
LTRKTAVLIISIGIGLLAAFLVYTYLRSVEQKYEKGFREVSVLVASKEIPKGTHGSAALEKDMVAIEKIPEKYVSDDAVRVPESISNKIFSISVLPGQQITSSMLESTTTSNLSLAVPPSMRAVAVKINRETGVSYRINRGDHVDVFATFKNIGASTKAFTRLLLQNVLVIDVPASNQSSEGRIVSGSGSSALSAEQTIILALSPEDAEKFVFAASNGEIWLALRPVNEATEVATPGQSVDTLFKKSSAGAQNAR